MLKIIEEYGKCSGIRLNSKKSSYVRINNCKLGPQILREETQIKVLGMLIVNNWKDMIDKNYSKIISACRGKLNSICIRNLNFVQKSWILNTFILSKCWYLGQILPPDKRHIDELKKMVLRYFWGSQIFKVEAGQLYLPFERGGLALVEAEVKFKALFIRNILYKNNVVNRKHYLIDNISTKNLTRNTYDWVNIAIEYEAYDFLNTSALIYSSLLSKQSCEPKIQSKAPSPDWLSTWENFSENYMDSDAKSIIYEILNDIYPNKEKLCSYNVRGLNNAECEICHELDTNLHRITNCTNSKEIWEWVVEKVNVNMKANLPDPMEILSAYIGTKNRIFQAVYWIVSEAIVYNMRHYKNPSLFVFKSILRNKRWDQRQFFVRRFGKYAFVF